MVTIKDIAKLANVDKGAVSRTLRNHPEALRLRPETRERIMKIAAELGYQPNMLAASTRTGIVKTIAVIGHFSHTLLYFSVAEVLGGVLSEGTRLGYSLKMYDDKDLGSTFAEISGSRIKYVISLSAKKPVREETAAYCRKNGIQLIYLYEHGHSEYPAVNVDNFLAASQAVLHLAEQGHKRIGLLCVPHRTELYSYIEERHNGYLDGLSKAGLIPDPDLIVCDEDVDRSVEKLLSLPKGKRPTALFGISDSLLLKAQRCAFRMGLKLPDELATFGFGNNEASELAIVPLSTVEESFFQRGVFAVKVLLGKKEGLPPLISGTYTIPPSLVIRESSLKPQGKKGREADKNR